jgi:ABC-2 type transport system ATP-binding protein
MEGRLMAGSTNIEGAGPPPEGCDPSVPALEIQDLSYRYGNRVALERIDLSLPSGRFAVLLGRNGAGKTTLFSLVTRLYGTQSGSIHVFGHDIQRESAAALSRLGVVFQQRTLDLDLTAGQNLIYHAMLHGLSFSEGRRRAQAELARLGLSGAFDRKVRQLSGGQARRVEMARALLHEPRLFLCDEATVGLDVESRDDLLRHVRALVRERQVSILWATHLIDEVAPNDLLVILHEGRVLAQGVCSEVIAKAGTRTLSEALSRLWEAA